MACTRRAAYTPLMSTRMTTSRREATAERMEAYKALKPYTCSATGWVGGARHPVVAAECADQCGGPTGVPERPLNGWRNAPRGDRTQGAHGAARPRERARLVDLPARDR